MAMCFSSTADVSAELAGASNHDLASLSTKARWQAHLLPGSLRLRLGYGLRALLLQVSKIPHPLETCW